MDTIQVKKQEKSLESLGWRDLLEPQPGVGRGVTHRDQEGGRSAQGMSGPQSDGGELA